jgi:hypothetical protein
VITNNTVISTEINPEPQLPCQTVENQEYTYTNQPKTDSSDVVTGTLQIKFGDAKITLLPNTDTSHTVVKNDQGCINYSSSDPSRKGSTHNANYTLDPNNNSLTFSFKDNNERDNIIIYCKVSN